MLNTAAHLLFICFVSSPTRCENDHRQNDQRHHSQDHHHGNPYAFPIPWRTVWTPQVLLLEKAQMSTAAEKTLLFIPTVTQTILHSWGISAIETLEKDSEDWLIDTKLYKVFCWKTALLHKGKMLSSAGIITINVSPSSLNVTCCSAWTMGAKNKAMDKRIVCLMVQIKTNLGRNWKDCSMLASHFPIPTGLMLWKI